MENKDLNPKKELVEFYEELKTMSGAVKEALKEVLALRKTKNFKQLTRLVQEKELSQLLSGYASLSRVRLDILKQMIGDEGMDSKVKSILSDPEAMRKLLQEYKKRKEGEGNGI